MSLETALRLTLDQRYNDARLTLCKCMDPIPCSEELPLSATTIGRRCSAAYMTRISGWRFYILSILYLPFRLYCAAACFRSP